MPWVFFLFIHSIGISIYVVLTLTMRNQLAAFQPLSQEIVSDPSHSLDLES